MPVTAWLKASVCGRSLTETGGFKSRRGHGYLSLRECVVLSGTDLCVVPITHTVETYRV